MKIDIYTHILPLKYKQALFKLIPPGLFDTTTLELIPPLSDLDHRFRIMDKYEDLKQVLSTYQGRSFIWELLSQARIYHTTFSENSLTSAFHEGMRQIGLQLIARIDAVDQNAYAKLRREAVRREDK